MAVETPVCDFGRLAPAFKLIGTDDEAHSLDDVRGTKGTVVMFLCNHCPYVRAVVNRLVDDVHVLHAYGIGFVAIMPNDTVAYPEDGFEAMKRFASAHRLPFPYLIDETQEIARAYGAVCTPDFFGFDAGLGLQYRGRLDAGRLELPPSAARRELREAMISVATTGHGPSDQTPSIGCSIKWRN
ncbi:MAG: thioredoxin family protein [Rhodospirillaceae bacterium]